jgi:hypothetical protein
MGQVHGLVWCKFIVLGLPLKACGVYSYHRAFKGLTCVNRAESSLTLITSRHFRNRWFFSRVTIFFNNNLTLLFVVLLPRCNCELSSKAVK